ncbi:hypothetical protein GOODEAATRI_024085 [Goodea atripinnis]|uniref:Uncharacterized protein n=1 Tax=Goodea atripinnis TaxID=208336 RepID=A0ABV0ND71_9TELE
MFSESGSASSRLTSVDVLHSTAGQKQETGMLREDDHPVWVQLRMVTRSSQELGLQTVTTSWKLTASSEPSAEKQQHSGTRSNPNRAGFSPSVWAGSASCQALKCPSLLQESSMVVRLLAAWSKHMAVIRASWGAEMVVFSTKLPVKEVWMEIKNNRNITTKVLFKQDKYLSRRDHLSVKKMTAPLSLFIKRPQL